VLFQRPDIDLPDDESEPVYVAPTFTAPKLIDVRFTSPLIPYVPCGSESVIVPFSLDPVSVQLSVNDPDTAPP
jgi:hypothetical protein